MKSIRRKLFLQIGLLTTSFIILLYIFNSFFLEPYYRYSTRNTIIDIYEEINATPNSEINSETLYYLVYSSRTFMELTIIDETNKTIYLPNNPLSIDSSVERLPPSYTRPPLKPTDAKDAIALNNKVSLYYINDSLNKHSFYLLSGYLDNDWRIEIRVPLASVNENINLFNRFIIFSGGIMLVFSIIVANYISKSFSKPILDMFHVTDHIKHLNFKHRCTVAGNNELGQLAVNINEMSYALKKNIALLTQTNNELEKEIAERIRIDQQRKLLLNNVSHELKTPLSLIQGYSEGLQLNLHKNHPKADFYCDVIIDESKKMDLLISELLDINRIESGEFTFKKEPIDLKEFLEYILHKLQPLFEKKNIIITKDFNVFESISSINIYADRLRTEQIFTNLLNNALAYVDKRKQIKLNICVIYVNDRAFIRCDIANTYPFVHKKELENWWNSFYKVEQSRTRENGGYGLGLPIIKAIQEADHNAYGSFYQDEYVHFYVDFKLL